MKWLRNLKIWKKIQISCAILILFTTVTSLVSIRLLQNANHAFDNFYAYRFRPVRELNKMFRNILQIRINMIQAVVLFEKGDMRAMKQRFASSDELAKNNNEIWSAYIGSGLEGKEKELADKLRGIQDSMVGFRKDFSKELNAKNYETALVKSNAWAEYYTDLKDAMTTLMQFQQDAAKDLEIHVRNDADFSLILNISILGASVFFGVLVTLVLTKSISTPVKEGLKFSRNLAEGDFTKRIKLDQTDELGILGASLNAAADDLEKTISDILVATQNLVQAIQEISSGNENLSQRTTEQASSLEEIASTLEESTATISQNADNSTEANNLALNASRLAQEGGQIMTDAVNSINEINEFSQQIGEIISVINEIAFQTNLLALNAAVEAARAGEQGRGFAVVASEVRNLAQRSGNAAKEISELIKNSLIKVERGTGLANRAGEALANIIQAVNDVSRFITEIASASEEQRRGTEQINTAVSDLDNMTQQNASMVEETASASEEIANQAQELLHNMQRFQICNDRLPKYDNSIVKITRA